jgi:hypothetical protein
MDNVPNCDSYINIIAGDLWDLACLVLEPNVSYVIIAVNFLLLADSSNKSW